MRMASPCLVGSWSTPGEKSLEVGDLGVDFLPPGGGEKRTLLLLQRQY